MRRIFQVFLFIIGSLLSAQSAFAETRIHRDGRGYTYRSSDGYTTQMYRVDTGARYQRNGNVALYSDSAGTVGLSYYGPTGRFDRFRNYDEGWRGSGFTPYGNPQLSTYRRSYDDGLSGTSFTYAAANSAYAPVLAKDRQGRWWWVIPLAGGALLVVRAGTGVAA